MTDRISIPALRDAAANLPPWPAPTKVMRPEVLLALVEAVEAAHAHVVSRRDRGATKWPQLLEALARFDFGEET